MQTYDFGAGRTDPSSFPTEALAEAAQRAIREVGSDLVHYPGPHGHLGLREVMAARESTREGVEVSPDRLALMNGSMQGVTLAAEALMRRPGDIIITEEVTYSGTIRAYSGLGAQLVGIPVDEQGMQMDALAETLGDLQRRGTSPAFIYTLTTYQNPTGSVMPRSRRERLLEIARSHGVIIVEDNCYADVHFEGEQEPSLYAIDDGPDLVYIGSLSKTLGPGVRLGYVMAQAPMLERLLARRFDAGNSVLAASIVAELFRDGFWDHVATTNAILKAKRDAVFAGLGSHPEAFPSFSRPRGGMFVWVRLPDDVDRERLYDLAQARGVMHAMGSGFHINGEDVPYLRLAFGSIQPELIRDGIDLLADCVQEVRATAPAHAEPAIA